MAKLTDESDFSITTALLWSTPDDHGYTPHEEHVLTLHCDRLRAAAEAFSWHDAARILSGDKGEAFRAILREDIGSAVKESGSVSHAWKVRVLVGEQGTIRVLVAPITLALEETIQPWPALPGQLPMQPGAAKLCQIFLDSQSLVPSLLTRHKTTSRGHYNDARTRANIEHDTPLKSEVLLFNDDGKVMEASLCTPYFFRGGEWITPPLSTGGNAGVSRRMALEAGLCIEKMLDVGELMNGEIVWLSNAIRGFMPGKLDLITNNIAESTRGAT